MAAPTFVTYNDSADWTSSTGVGGTHTAGSVSVQSGDILVVVGATESGAITLATPTGGGLTYTQQQKPNADNDSSHAQAYIWTAPATSTTSITVASVSAGGSHYGGIGVYVFRNATVAGSGSAGNENSGTAPSLAITTVGANSAVVFFNADWNAIDGASRTWRTINSITPTAGNGGEKEYGRNGNWGSYSAYWSDVGTAGAKTTGLSAPTGQLAVSVAIEVQGTAVAPAEGSFPSLQIFLPFAGPTPHPSARALQLLGDASGEQFPALLETSAGDDAAVVTAAVPAADTATGTDSAAVAAAVPLADTAAGADAAAVVAAVPLADAAAGTDAVVITVPASLADTAAAADLLATTHAIPLPETAAGNDVLTVAVALTLADTVTTDDSVSIPVVAAVDPVQAWPTVPAIAVAPRNAVGQLLGDATYPNGVQSVPLDEALSATDALTVAVAASLTDTAAGADDAALAGAIPVSDGANGTDSLNVAILGTADAFQAVPNVAWMFVSPKASSTQPIGDSTSVVTMPDTATASDSLSVAPAIPLTDTATGTDSLAVAATFTVTEAGTATDDVVAGQVVPLTDTATGTDSLAVAADTIFDPYQYRSAPPAMAVYPKAAAGQLLGDASTGVVGGASSVSLADTAAASDSLAISVTITVADTATAVDVMSPTAGPLLTELISAADALAITVVLALTESLSGLDDLVIGGSRITGNVYPNPDSGASGNAYPRGSRQVIGSVR